MQTSEMRALLYEFGFVLPEGHRALLNELPTVLLEAQSRLPAMLLDRRGPSRTSIEQAVRFPSAIL